MKPFTLQILVILLSYIFFILLTIHKVNGFIIYVDFIYALGYYLL